MASRPLSDIVSGAGRDAHAATVVPSPESCQCSLLESVTALGELALRGSALRRTKSKYCLVQERPYCVGQRRSVRCFTMENSAPENPTPANRSMGPVRILVVDDHEVMRIGVRMLCASHPEWQICDEASTGEEAIRKLQECAPNLVILDLSLSGAMNGFNVTAEMRKIAPSVKIIMYSLHDVAFSARRAGADAFVAKSSGAAALSATIQRLAAQPQSEVAKQAEVQRLGPFDFFRQSRG